MFYKFKGLCLCLIFKGFWMMIVKSFLVFEIVFFKFSFWVSKFIIKLDRI